MLVDPLLQLDHQGRRVRLERLDLGEFGGRVRHVLPVLAGRDDRVIFVPERRESGRLREAMLRDGKLDDRAILRRRREGEPHLFGRDLHRVQRIVRDGAGAHERGARRDGHDDETDDKHPHRVRSRTAEELEDDRETIDHRRVVRAQPKKDSSPNSGARP